MSAAEDRRHRAVIFDLGGVVYPSPIEVMRSYEAECGLPRGFLSAATLADPEWSAWSRLERGELTLASFVPEFEAECASAGHAVDVAELMRRITSGLDPRSEMLHAIAAIREAGLLTAALTNNWVDDERTPGTSDLDRVFDLIVESARVRMRKPDPRIYEHVCASLAVEPHVCVFLDDIGANLKPARAMGMTTIKVDEPDAALTELAAVLGLDLRR